MPRRNLAQVDLNLLVDLELLLQEQHVGRAAGLAGISHSAMSRHLSQLRETFEDPLLVSQGRGLGRTAFAESLLPRLRPILADIEEGLFAPRIFDPATATATWTLAATDSTHQLIAGTLLRLIRPVAPRLCFRFIGPEVLFRRGLDDGSADLGIGPRPSEDSTYRARTIFHQKFRTLTRADHPFARSHADPSAGLDAFCEADHGLVAVTSKPGSLVDDALAQIGRERRVIAITQHFRTAVELVDDAGLLVTLPSLVARMLARSHDLLALPPPVELPSLAGAMVWHPRYHDDPAHTWVRAQILAATSQVVESLDDGQP